MSREERYTDRDRDVDPFEEERTDERRRSSEPRRNYPRDPETDEQGTYAEQDGRMGRDNAWSEQHDEEIRKRADAQRKQWHEAEIEEGDLTDAEKEAAKRARGRGGQGPLESGA